MNSFDQSKLTIGDEEVLKEFFERRKTFDQEIKKNNSTLSTCPSCGFPTIEEKGDFEICPICNWEDDTQDDPFENEIWGGVNRSLSLTESRLKFGSTLNDLSKDDATKIKSSLEEILKLLEKQKERLNEFDINKVIKSKLNDPIWKDYETASQIHIMDLIKLK